MADILNTACVGRTVSVSSACGCTLTRATITGFTPDDIVNLGNKEIYLTKAILDAKEAEMLGVPESNLMKLLNSSITDVKGKLMTDKVDEQSVIMPFIQRGQQNYINANFWTIKTGVAPVDAGVGNVPVNAWDITLGLGNSPFQTTLDAIERYFVPGSTLIVKTWDSVTTKAALTLVFTIYRSVNADAGNTRQAKVTVYPNVSAASWAGYSPSQKKVYQPVFGMAENGANSVLDYESYCQQQPSDLSKRIVVSWLQTTRQSYCREQAYEETLDLIMKGRVNDYLKGFKYQSIATQQKLMRAAYDREQMNSIFFGQAIDIDNQTTNNWRNLPAVYDVANGTCPLGYKASSLGIFTILAACNRVIDMAGQRLDLADIFSRIYYLRRFREAAGDRVPIIDSMTDRFTAKSIFEVMSRYYKTQYDVNTVKYFQADQKITHDNIVLFTYDIYDIKEAGAQWAVFVDDYFNDLVDGYNTSVVGWNFSIRANNLWFLDWSDIKKGVAGSKQVTRKSPNPNTDLAAYQCVISPNVKTYDLRSETWTVMVDRPERHLIYHNFASGCPRIAVTVCTVPQS